MNAVSNVSASPVRKRRNSLLRRVLILIVALLVLAGAWFAWKKFSAPNPRDKYQIVDVQRGDVEDLVTATGTVQPRDYVDVGAQVSGQLKKIYVEVGSQVKEGDLLAEIDPTVFLATVDGRRASLRNLQATMVDKESQLKLAELQYTRQKNMLVENATTADAFQSAEATLKSAHAQIEALKAQIDQTESSLRADEANLSYARIYAPMTGTIVSIAAKQGQTLNANQQAPTLLRIADMNTMTVQTQVSEADVSKLRPGMESYFTTLGSQGRRWYGTLRKLEPTPTVTNNVVLYNALFDVPNQNNALLPNMTAQVFFVAAQARDVLLVPAGAVVRAQRQRGQRGTEGGAPGSKASGAAGEAPAKPQTEARAESRAEAAASRPAGDAKGERPAHAHKPAAADGASPAIAQSTAAPAADEDAERAARRARWAAMSPEEREAFRARREAMGGEGGGGPRGAGPRGEGPRGDGPRGDAARKESTPDAPPKAAAGNAGKDAKRGKQADSEPADPAEAEQRKQAQKAATPSARASAPVDRGLASWGSSSGQRGPRKAKVKVIDAEGKIEEREVTLGISNRVQIEIVSGLKEGEDVIAGEKLPANDKQASRANQQGGPGMPPGMGAPGMGGGARGR
ncbi:efflux RND transporter periplasmic adaptor subunit [Niveibacterium sp. SC-1]|uniref:efflux RND transporter periplasmic adaptor subunit n=1 Tax=Niveibacterium sp. SC-1 TaxID=3135646 RepID=UPI00311FDB2F